MRRMQYAFVLLFVGLGLFRPTLTFATSVTGRINLQGRQEHHGIIIQSYDSQHLTTITSIDGSFSLNQLEAGTQWLWVDAPLYLGNYVKVTSNGTQSISVTPEILSGGDINGDNYINIADATLLTAHFGQDNTSVDINADGQVNIQDLAILGGNLGKMSPSQPDDNEDISTTFLPIISK